MDTTPAPVSEGLGSQDPGNDTLVSDPSERGTPRAALVDALFSEDVEQCRQLLDAHPELVNTPLKHRADYRVKLDDSAWGCTYRGGYQNVTPVVFASLVPRFREKRIDCRELSPAGLAIIALLVERGTALEISPGADRWTSYLLTEVCRDYDSPEALRLLVRIGADICTRRLDDWSRTLLQVAAGRGAIGAVGFLLDRGVPMSYTGSEGDSEIDGTPLHWAAANGRHQAVRLLLSRGALPDMEKTDRHGCTPLDCAAKGLFWEDTDTSISQNLDREETIRLLVDAGAELTALDRQVPDWATSDTPLGYVSSWGSADLIQYLAGKGSDIHQRRSYPGPNDSCFPYGAGGNKATPLHRSAHNWNAAGVQALLDLGADPDATDEYGRQPLHWATIGQCLDRFGSVTHIWSDALRVEPRSPSFTAKLAALELTISHLVAHDASIDRQDAFGRTPLHYAAYMKLAGAVTLLVKGGADSGVVDNEGRTALHHLADPLYHPHYNGNEPADSDLEEENLQSTLAEHTKSVDVNHIDNTGSTALHIAARCASDTAVAPLLNLGADPNMPDPEGLTPLLLAARPAKWVHLHTYELREYGPWRRRATRIKALLLGAGADASVRDAEGKTAAEIEEELELELRQGRVKYLEWLARPRPEYSGRGRGRGRGFGRGRGGPPDSVPGNGGAEVSAGAGHGRGEGSGPPAAGL